MATTTEAMGAIGVAGGRRSALALDWQAPDGRRMLQLALATVWLLDAVLQFQPFMFTRAFGTGMIGGAAVGNPSLLAHQITAAGRDISHHATVSNTVFALIQLVIAFGIAWRPTIKVALAGSVVWALAVWWIGEGLGGVLTGAASPLTGAPGAVILYALLAVLLWPTGARSGSPDPPFVAARPVGPKAARGLWLVLWGSMAYDALQAANRSAQGLHDTIAAVALGQPRWLSSLDTDVARLVALRGLGISIVLAVICAGIAVGVFLPVTAARTTLVVALVLSVVIWVVGEAFGDIFSGTGTDPNTGPLLILLALAFWPRRLPRGEPVPAPAVPPAPAMSGS